MQRFSRVFLAIIAATVDVSAYAGGFSLYTEGSAAELGVFAAGAAAEANDASIGWYNPAGLVMIQKNQVVFSGVGVFPSTRLTGTSQFNTEEVPPYMQSFTNLQGGRLGTVPALHYAHPLGERATFGFSVVSPYGLSTDWGKDSSVRYAGTLTELLTVNVSPELGGKITDNLSIGAGVDLQWSQVRFDATLGSPAELQFLQSIGGAVTATTLDSTSSNTGTSTGVGFHAGVLGWFNDNHTRLGLNYQSSIQHSFTGNSVLTGRLADPDLTDAQAVFTSSGLMSNKISLPAVSTLSAYHSFNKTVALLSSLIYTEWSCFKTIALNNVAAFVPEEQTQGVVNTSTVDNYRNTWRAALGVNINLSDTWMIRFGTGYDQTPTVNAERDIRLPDSNRAAISSGLHYQMNANFGVDVGYVYLWGLNNSTVNKTMALGERSSYIVNAVADNSAQLVGLQAVISWF